MSLSSVATSAAIGGALLGASYLVKNSMRYSGAPPGPTRIPIIGNVELAPADRTYFNKALQELCKKYGPIFCMYVGNSPIVVISDYTLLREAFVTRSTETAGRPDQPVSLAYNPGYPNTKGIINSNYSDEWKRQRSAAITILRSLGWGKGSIENKIIIQAEAVLEELSNKKGEAFNPEILFGTCVSNIICSLLFGDQFEYGDTRLQHISDFFLAGSETTTTTLQWAMLFMANNQDVQEKLFKELNAKMTKDQLIQFQDRDHLPYTEATIMEVQRIAALAPIAVPHTALVDITIGGYRIPKNAEIWGNIYGILKEPRTFPEPEKFKPERFLNETLDSTKRPDQWIPFSLGRRSCLGEQLARQELFLFFSNIMKSYKVLPPKGIEKIEYREVFKFVLKPSEYEVRFVKR